MLAVPARRAAHGARSCPRARRPRRCGSWPDDRQPGRAAIGHACWRRASTAARCCATGCRIATTTRRASCGWRGRASGATPPLARSDGLGVADVAACSGAAGAEQPRLARALPARVRRARHQPDQDRVPAAARGASAATCSSPTWLPRDEDAERCSRRSPGCGEICARRYGVLGCYPAAAEPVASAGTRGGPPLDSGRENGEHSPTRAGGVRVAFRAPAARTCDIAHHGDGWPGARSERDVRADQRVHGAPRGRAAAEGKGRAARARAAGSCTPRARRSRGRW